MADGGVELIDRAAAAARLPEVQAAAGIGPDGPDARPGHVFRVRVGAAVLGGSGSAFPGCNVESASYGAHDLRRAERGGGGRGRGETAIRACVVVTPTADPSSPCGICRQLLAEFGGELLVFAASSASDAVYVARLADLLPLSFGPGNLAGTAGAAGAAGAARGTMGAAGDSPRGPADHEAER